MHPKGSVFSFFGPGNLIASPEKTHITSNVHFFEGHLVGALSFNLLTTWMEDDELGGGAKGIAYATFKSPSSSCKSHQLLGTGGALVVDYTFCVHIDN